VLLHRTFSAMSSASYLSRFTNRAALEIHESVNKEIPSPLYDRIPQNGYPREPMTTPRRDGTRWKFARKPVEWRCKAIRPCALRAPTTVLTWAVSRLMSIPGGFIEHDDVQIKAFPPFIISCPSHLCGKIGHVPAFLSARTHDANGAFRLWARCVRVACLGRPRRGNSGQD